MHLMEIREGLIENPVEFLENLRRSGKLADVFPELVDTIHVAQRGRTHKGNPVYAHTLDVLSNIKHDGDLVIIYAAMLHDIAKPMCHVVITTPDGSVVDKFYNHEEHGAKLSTLILSRICESNDIIYDVYDIIKNHAARYRHPSMEMFLRSDNGFRNNRELFNKLMVVMLADCKTPEEVEQARDFESVVNRKYDQLGII